MLTPGKQNDGAPQPVVGLTFTFAETSIRLCRADLTKVAALVDGLPLHGRIANVLKGGARTVEDIASTLTAKPNSVTQSLRRGRGNLFLVTAGADGVERWGVLERRSVDP